MNARSGLLVAGTTLLLLAGCTTTPPPPEEGADIYRVTPDYRARTNQPYVINGITYRPLPTTEGYVEKGIASWYGADFHNRATSIGERYDMYGISAAHTVLPIPCLVRVTNLENGRQMIIRVNDRGPFVKNRLIDLSYGAAKIMGYAEKGTAMVMVETVSGVSKDLAAKQGFPEGKGEPPPPASKTVAIKQQPRMFVQLGAFQDQGNAQKLAQRLRPFGEVKIAPTQVGNKQFYRVRLVTGSSAEEADALVDRLESKGFPGGQIVVE